MGYLLWTFIAATIVLSIVNRVLITRRAARDALTPVSFGPPLLKTKADYFVAGQVAPQLRAGEVIQHQAYVFDREPGGGWRYALARADFAVLTNQRILLMRTRVGAFGVLRENRGFETTEREWISNVTVDDRSIVLTFTNGSERTLWVLETRGLSNQAAFLRDVPRILRGAEVPQGGYREAAST